MKVAIHQPNFFPWLGIFHRIRLVDRFIVFDHVQAMRGKSWLSRNQLIIGGERKWLTMPTVKSGAGFQAVSDVCINYQVDPADRHLKTLQANYGRTPFYTKAIEFLRELYGRRHERIADFNLDFIKWACAQMSIDTEFVHSKDLLRQYPYLAELKGNDIVLELCKCAGATSYVSGTGCLDFILPASFEEAGIGFYWQEFKHPEYNQGSRSDFQSHLSVLDAFFHIGPDNVRDLLEGQPEVHFKSSGVMAE